MLKRFRVSNFRNLVNVEFTPVGSNLLIGPNNSGKTNLCSALRFMSLSASADLAKAAVSAVGDTWNIANAYVTGRTLQFDVTASLAYEGEALEFGYTLHVDVLKGSPEQGVTLRACDERLVLTGGGFEHTVLMNCQNGKAELFDEAALLRGGMRRTGTSAPGNSTMLSRLYDLESNPRANMFRQYLQSWLYFNLNPNAMRSPQVHADRLTIYPDGANLSKALFLLHNERPRVERKIIEALKAIEPKIDLFTFFAPDPQSVFLFLEDREQNRFRSQSISDGTLRYLVFAYLIYTSADNEGAGAPLIMIEEPENGLYVGHLRSLFDKIDPSGEAGQFIFTSHSPYFIDLWESNPEGIHILQPGKPSAVLVKPDAAKLQGLLKEMPLGELHFREMLT